MKLAMVLALAACRAGSGSGGDAGASDDGGASVTVTGRVCILKDLRRPTLCDDTKDASHLVLTLGTRTAVKPAMDGSFSFAAELGTDLTWRVSGHLGTTADVSIVPTVIAYGTENIVPVITADNYASELSGTHVVLADQEGSIVVRVVSGITPAGGVVATTTRATTSGETFYDGTKPGSWLPDTATGALGIVWFPDVPLANKPPTTAQIGLGVPLGAPPVTVTAVVENAAITFVTKEIQ